MRDRTEDLDEDGGRIYSKERSGDSKATGPLCGSRELISWRLAQKYFFNENFGGAVIDGRRNIFDTTLNFSGIAFLTEPRAIAPPHFAVACTYVRTPGCGMGLRCGYWGEEVHVKQCDGGRTPEQYLCRAELCEVERTRAFLHRGGQFFGV